MSKEALKIGVDLGTEKDEQCAVIILHYDGIDHIIYETHDKEQIEALNKIKQQEAIDNANPSEALEWFGEQWVEYGIQDTVMQIKDTKEFTTIKQALLKAQKEHNSVNLLMQELDCKDFAELRKYARCGYQTFRNAKGANYDNIIIDEAVIPSEEIVEKSLKALEIIKENFIIKFDKEIDIEGNVWGLLVSIQAKENKGEWDCTACANLAGYEEEFNLLKEVLE